MKDIYISISFKISYSKAVSNSYLSVVERITLIRNEKSTDNSLSYSDMDLICICKEIK